MSVVKKLYIQGVRSFSPNDNRQQMIEFQTPLTIILGVNGSGKTTIIEALKYAITNKYPPNCTNGSSFVNDPKLTNGMDSMAVVKLEMVDARGNTILTTRRVKVSVKDKQGNLTKKEMDATMKTIDMKGVGKEINSKCVDIKTEMCRAMGVSEAILNHVILCHQEDSCWPLDEAKKVKEKFDSIFNTTMYIKCLDQFAKQDRDLGERAKLEHKALSYVVENRKAARRKKKDLEDKTIELKSVSDQISQCEKELKELEDRLRSLQDLEKEYTEMANKVSEAKGKLEMVETQVTELKKNIKEVFEGDIPSLEQFFKKFVDQKQSKEAHLKTLQAQFKKKEDELKALSVTQQKHLVEEGKYQQEEAANQKRLAIVVSQIAEIVQTVKKLKEGSQDVSFSNSMNACIEICEGDEINQSPKVVIRALSSAIRAKESETDKTKAQYDKEEKEIQKSIDELRTKKASLETEIGMKKKQIEDNKVSAIEIKNRLKSIEGSNDALIMLADDEKKYVKQIESIQNSGVLEKCETEIKTLSRELKDLEKETVDASEKVELLTKDQNELDQIAFINRQKAQKQKVCNEIMRRIEDDLKTFFKEIPEKDLVETVAKKINLMTKELNEKRMEQKQLEKQCTVTATELKRVKRDLERKQAEIEGSKEQIDTILEDRDFDEVYNEVSEELDETQKSSYYAEAAIFLYKKYILKLNKKDCCPLCKRDFETKQKTAQLITNVEEEIEKMRISEPLGKEATDKLKKKQQELIDLKPIWEEKTKLETLEIPALLKKRDELEAKSRELEETTDDLNGTIVLLDNEISTLRTCAKESSLYESAKEDLKKHEDGIKSIESRRDPKAKELQDTLNLSDAKTLLQDLQGTSKAKQVEKDNKSDMLNKRRNDLTKLQEDKNKVREEILRITSELQNREALEVQKKELEASNKHILEEIGKLNKSLPSALGEISGAEKRKEDCTKRRDNSMQALRSEKETLEKQRSKLSDISKQIDEFESTKHIFADGQRRAQECKKKVEHAEKEKTDLNEEIATVKNEISNHELKQRNLQDNLSYKQKLEEISKLKVELAERQKLFASTQNRGVTAEKREVSQKHQELFAKMNKHTGVKSGIQTAIREITLELRDKHLANAEAEYTEKLVKKTIFEKAQRDVRRYRTALDNAIMQFHSKRMQTINQILWDYWRRIYKGNDIDAIQIRTEAAGTKAVPGTAQKVKIDSGKASRKNYNYRVVMVRRGHELDMRGRCSAGQRVLASIIIRIALAESFSARCGIITLDEPTTNLDVRNINSLADALSNLAESMSSRNNFQLIVITHDQEFMERLSAVDSVEKYCKVTRDDLGFSLVSMVSK